MIKVAICDDDAFFVEKVAKECAIFFGSKSIEYDIRQALSGKMLLKELETQEINLLIIDIDMPQMTGFEVAEQLRLIKKVEEVVFITNQNHLVYECFPYSPFGFIRKEALEKELFRVLDRYLEKYMERQKKYTFKVDGIEREIVISDIVYIESKGHELLLNTTGEIFKLRGTFQEVEEVLGKEQFIRVHQGYLINAQFISWIGKNECHLKTNQSIPVSRYRMRQVKNQYTNYLRMRD